MENTIVGIIVIAVGIAVFIFRKKFIRDCLAVQNKLFGLHYGEKEIKAGERFLPAWSAIVITWGIIKLTGFFDR